MKKSARRISMECSGSNSPNANMSEQQVIERTDEGTTIRTGTDGQRMKIPHTLPILPIRNIVVFPGTVMPLNIGRAKSKALLDEVMPSEKLIGVVTQRNAETE